MTYTYSYSGADCKAYAWFEGSSDYYESLSKKNQNILQPVLTTIRSKVKRKEYAKKYPDMEKPEPPRDPELDFLENLPSPLFDIEQEIKALNSLTNLIENRIFQIFSEGDFTINKAFDEKSINFLNREEEFYLAITDKMLEDLFTVIEDSKLLPLLQKPSFLEIYRNFEIDSQVRRIQTARAAAIENYFKNPKDKINITQIVNLEYLDFSLPPERFFVKPLALKSLKDTTLDFINKIILAIIDNVVDKIDQKGINSFDIIKKAISKSAIYKTGAPLNLNEIITSLDNIKVISETNKNNILDSKADLSMLLGGDSYEIPINSWELDSRVFYTDVNNILYNMLEKLAAIKLQQNVNNIVPNSIININNSIVEEQYKIYNFNLNNYKSELAKYNTQIEYDVTDKYEEFAEDIQVENEVRIDNQLFEWLNNPVHLNSLATISLSVHDAKAPVRRLGHVGVSGFTKSIRTIAGTMVFLIIEDHPLRNLIARDPSNVDMNYYYFSLDKEKGRGNFGSETTTSFYSSSKLSSLISKFNLMLRYQTEVYKRPDMLDREALNVFGSKALFFEPKELNGRASMIIKGIEITGESLVTSVNDMVTEVVIQFVAEDVVMFRAENTKTETDIKEAYERSVSKLPDENRKPISVSIDTDKPLNNPISSTVTRQTEYIENGPGVLRDQPPAPRVEFNLPRWDRR